MYSGAVFRRDPIRRISSYGDSCAENTPAVDLLEMCPSLVLPDEEPDESIKRPRIWLCCPGRTGRIGAFKTESVSLDEELWLPSAERGASAR